VSLNGKPQKGIKVDFCTTDNRPRFSVITNGEGVAAPPVLPSGYCDVTATLEEGVAAYLNLKVSPGNKVSTFPMDLTPPVQAAQRFLEAAEKLPIRHRVQEFRGSIQDPGYAAIPGVDVKVVRKGSKDKTFVARVKSDADGHFSAQLAPGTYLAFFSCAGFRTEIVSFEVSAQGEKEMRVELQVGQVTESLRVSAHR